MRFKEIELWKNSFDIYKPIKRKDFKMIQKFQKTRHWFKTKMVCVIFVIVI